MNPLAPVRRVALSRAAQSLRHQNRTYARLSLIGRLGADPEMKATSNGRNLVTYPIGTSHGPADKRETSWFKVACFPPPGQNEGAIQDTVMGLPKG